MPIVKSVSQSVFFHVLFISLSTSSACADDLRKQSFFSTVKLNPAILTSAHFLSSFLLPAANVLHWRAEPQKLWHVQDVLEGAARLPRRALPGWCGHLPAHGRLQHAASRPQIHHQLCGLLRQPAEAFLPGGAVPRLARLLGVEGEGGAAESKEPGSTRWTFSWTLALYECGCCTVDVCVFVRVRVLRGEFSWAMADGKMERVPKMEIKECCFFSYCFSRRRWNLACGRVFLLCCVSLFSGTIADDGVRKKRHAAPSRC